MTKWNIHLKKKISLTGKVLSISLRSNILVNFLLNQSMKEERNVAILVSITKCWESVQ